MKAFLKNYRQSPRKVRLVTDLVRGKSVENAVSELDRMPKRASAPIKKLILGAVANASDTGVRKENLFIKEIRVDKGIVMKRMMPRAMGRGADINKRTSHIIVILGERAVVSSGKKDKKEKKEHSLKMPKVLKVKKEKTAVKPATKKHE